MPRIYVTTRSGEKLEIEAESSGVLMELLKDNDIDGIVGMCGGCCSCATCHVHVDAGSSVELPEISDDESALLSGLLSYTSESRLSCQIPVTDEIDGLSISIPLES